MNPHRRTPTAPSRQRVYQFHHLGRASKTILYHPISPCNTLVLGQDDCKVLPKLLMVSLSNHVRLEPSSFDKLRMSGRW